MTSNLSDDSLIASYTITFTNGAPTVTTVDLGKMYTVTGIKFDKQNTFKKFTIKCLVNQKFVYYNDDLQDKKRIVSQQ